MYSMRVFENSAKENIWNSGSNLCCRGVIICNFHVVLVPNPAETERKSLTFMGPCIINVFLSTTNKMQRYTIFFIVVSALMSGKPARNM